MPKVHTPLGIRKKPRKTRPGQLYADFCMCRSLAIFQTVRQIDSMKKVTPDLMNEMLAQATYEEIKKLAEQRRAATDPVTRAELQAEIQERINFCDSLGYTIEVQKVKVINVATGKRPG